MENPGYKVDSAEADPSSNHNPSTISHYYDADASLDSVVNPGYDPDFDDTSPNTISQITSSSAIEPSEINLYARRWVILAIFSLNTMMNEVIWISLGSVANIVKEYYEVDNFHINWLSTIFSAVYITVVLTVTILNKYGLKATIVGGSLMNTVASILRLVGYRRNGYYYAFAGNLVGGIGQSFLIFIPPTLSSVWFGEKERARASAIGMSMNMLGISVGFLMGSLFVPHSTDPEVVKQGMFTTLLTQCVICVVLLLAAVVFIKTEPPTPPTYSQAIAVQRKMSKMSRRESKISQGECLGEVNSVSDTVVLEEKEMSTGIRKNWRMLLTSINFHLLVQAYAICFAMMATCSTLLNQMMTMHFPTGHTQHIGLMGAAATVFGLASMMLVGIWIDKTRQYKLISCTIFAAGAITSLTFTLVLKYTTSFPLTFVCFCLHGFFMFPYLAVGLEYIAEVMYPVKESILSFICLFLSTLYGTAFITVLGVIMKHVGNTDVTGYIIVATYSLGFLCVAFVNGELKRYQVDVKKDRTATLATIAE